MIAPKVAENALRFDSVTLANGLRIIGEHNPAAASVAAGYFVHTGARDETPEVSGVSHFLEHMAFKGNEQYSPEDINRIFDEIGAQYNAYTSQERTVYYGAVLPERLPAMLELLSLMMRPVLREADFDVEKKVILEEIAMYEDRPSFRVFDLSGERYWQGHPLGNSILGSSASITALKKDQMEAYLDERYSPGNLMVVAAGNYDWDAVVAQVERESAGWQQWQVERKRPAAHPLAGRDGRIDANLSRTHVAVHAPGVGMDDARRYAAGVLADAIGDSGGSRLYWELVDKGLADNASLDHESSEDQGLFSGYISAAPGRADAVIDRFMTVLRTVQDEGVTAEEWRRAQRKLATGLTLRAETPLGRLSSLGATFQATGEYLSVDEVVSRVLGAQLATGLDLLADRPFDKAFVYTLGPDAV
ncbi:MAG TPA: pitrilysin family protein [Trueperaceae bacterium]|nr:pitrilysin family protein [Trueperaceae bacterium]